MGTEQGFGIKGAEPRRGLMRDWLSLLLLQAVLALLVFWSYIDGSRYFAFLDIAADTYEIFTSHAVHLGRLLQREGWSGWSFGIGLGAPVSFMFSDAFRLLTMAGGPEHVLELRIWVYLLKLVLGGAAFFLLVRTLVERREAALLVALLYSFCGYVVINGVWDPEANPFIFFPLVLWALVRCMRSGDRIALPLSVAAALVSGIFFLTLSVSLAVAFAVLVAMSERRIETLRLLSCRAVPLIGLGFVVAAPVALPIALQQFDSPRLPNSGSLLAKIWNEGFQVLDIPLWLLQLGSFFHKDLFGSANTYRGYMNYLEGPGFWVGMLPLLVLPQLWKGDRGERRALLVALVAIALYIVVPAFRLAAFGFASPYFRSTTLWVSLPLLLLAARAFQRVFDQGVDLRLLGIGVVFVGGCLGGVAFLLPGNVVPAHVGKVAVFIAAGTLVLLFAGLGWLRGSRLASSALVLSMVEIVAVDWPSMNTWRSTVSATRQPFRDVTEPALAAIRRADSGVYRIEKTFTSVSEADAVAQDYMGVKSYYYHGSAVVDFHRNMDLMRRFPFPTPPVNYTNWLAGPDERFAVAGALAVKYVISKDVRDWPGFTLMGSGPGWYVYRNELALPLGVVHTRQVTRREVGDLRRQPPDRQRWFRDLTLFNAVVLDEPMPRWGRRWDLGGHAARGILDMPALYAQPAEQLRRTGLQLTSFKNDHLEGRIAPTEDGILVFSIPAYRGWSLRVDGQEVPLVRADFGFIAAPVTAGPHAIELRYALPGLVPGLAMGLAGLLLVAALGWRRPRRDPAASLSGA
ncbi:MULTISPECIES: YfhO family protein [Ramlibacter]|uniref:YfhO family protein n=1 Tax=Ramlibacter pinisoli TaxID=2682844 RepID=A0A6N8J1F9_9BURK|nr:MULTISPECIES: YfhO family protein [Ramlibacter]MBA2962925.1 YfhO family protein [Ramlibacter sp. CGMCC 1.13660]MVQ32868.1 YfhO family protein [Ramlibacter pinisoli]